VSTRATQSPDYWGSRFTLSGDDRELLLNLFVEDEQPRSSDELAQALIRHRVEREETALRRKQQAQGTLYQPKRAFQVDEQVVFPALDFTVGRVTAVRSGFNPDVAAPFKVMQVNMDGGGVREFVAEFDGEHRLNDDAVLLSPTDELVSPEEIYARYQKTLVPHLRTLLHNTPEFVWLAGKWFPRSLLVGLNEGQLNIAEAILDMNGGGPLPTASLLPELGLPAEVNRALQVFSLNYALLNDERFDEVGPAGEVLWFLNRLEPVEVINIPPRLKYIPADVVQHGTLTLDLLRAERSIDDELSQLPPPDEAVDEVTFTLMYPHRRSGTVPLSPTIAKLFPSGRTHRIRFQFEDARTGKRWPGWVVRERHYAFGLDSWYNANEVPTGAYVELRRGAEPDVVIVGLQGNRVRREWVRVAVPKDGRLTFEMLKRPISCDYDEQMIVFVDDASSIDKVWQQADEHGSYMPDLLEQLLPELAKLSPQGNVHARTLYSAINLINRTPPGPLFAALISQTKFRAMGDGYWLAR
jgi:hypothetical protein